MNDIGNVTHKKGVHTARCAVEGCPWTAESERDGDVAHELMEHNAEEHARG